MDSQCIARKIVKMAPKPFSGVIKSLHVAKMQCSAKRYIFQNHKTTDFKIFRTNCAHDHDKINEDSGKSKMKIVKKFANEPNPTNQQIYYRAVFGKFFQNRI